VRAVPVQQIGEVDRQTVPTRTSALTARRSLTLTYDAMQLTGDTGL
jgi:hypothetical protein